MTRTFLLGFGTLISRAQTPTASDKELGYEPLFNGQDLGEWVGDTEQWTVVDGVIVGKSNDGKPDSTLRFGERDFVDFEFRFDLKVIKGAGSVSVRGPGV